MFLLEGKEMPRLFLFSRSRYPKNSRRAGGQLDAFQRAVIVFTIVFSRRRQSRRPRSLRSLMLIQKNVLCSDWRISIHFLLQASD